MRDPLGFCRRPEWSRIAIVLYANCMDVRTTATKVKTPAVTQERIGTDYGLHYWACRFALSGGHGCTRARDSVPLCRTYRRIRWSAPVIRDLEAAEGTSLGGIGVYPGTPEPSQAGSVNSNPLSVSNSIRSCSS
jgi:hypothetical protein